MLVWLAKTTLPVVGEPGLGVFLPLAYDPASSYASGFWNLGATPGEDSSFWAVDWCMKTKGYYFSGHSLGPPSHQATTPLPSKKLEASSTGSSVRYSRRVVEIRMVKQREQIHNSALFVCWQQYKSLLQVQLTIVSISVVVIIMLAPCQE